MQSDRVTHRIHETAFELLERHPEGLRWSELLAQIQASDPGLHPKTVNGCVWKLVQRFPDKVYKPSKGLFRLVKYKSAQSGHTIAGSPIPEAEATRPPAQWES